jgi:hypothetical protein
MPVKVLHGFIIGRADRKDMTVRCPFHDLFAAALPGASTVRRQNCSTCLPRPPECGPDTDMPRQATITTALARMACGLALALAWGCAWAAGSWQTGATQVFRHAELPGDVFPIAMLQDRHGVIWLGTQSGLIKWDGHRLHRYVADASKAGSIQSSYITGLHEDAAGRLWVATDGGGLARFDPQTAGFTTIPAGAGGLSSPRVMSLASDGKGTVWVGTGNGLNRLVPGTGQVHRGPEDGTPRACRHVAWLPC